MACACAVSAGCMRELCIIPSLEPCLCALPTCTQNPASVCSCPFLSSSYMC